MEKGMEWKTTIFRRASEREKGKAHPKSFSSFSVPTQAPRFYIACENFLSWYSVRDRDRSAVQTRRGALIFGSVIALAKLDSASRAEADLFTPRCDEWRVNFSEHLQDFSSTAPFMISLLLLPPSGPTKNLIWWRAMKPKKRRKRARKFSIRFRSLNENPSRFHLKRKILTEKMLIRTPQAGAIHENCASSYGCQRKLKSERKKSESSRTFKG